MNINKKADMTPFDLGETPNRQSPLLLPLIWAASFAATGGPRLTIRKQNMQGIKPPYLLLSMHQGFFDYFITPRALFPHRATYVSDMEGFANYGKWLYGRAGCIPTRRFVANPALIRGIRHVTEKNKDIIVVFPEARHSNVGTNSPLPQSTGKLAKLLGLPVVVQKLHGSYLACPIWDEEHTRKVPLETTLECILTPDKLQTLPAADVTALINRHFAYDEYRWQLKSRIQITYPKRAEGLHKVLYQCRNCSSNYTMRTINDELFCTNCNTKWKMDEYGRLAFVDAKHPETQDFIHIPDWYEWQRAGVQAEIQARQYQLNHAVQIDALPNEKGFVPLGKGRLTHTPEGFTLTLQTTGEVKIFRSSAMHSVHTEYGYREKGDCCSPAPQNFQKGTVKFHGDEKYCGRESESKSVMEFDSPQPHYALQKQNYMRPAQELNPYRTRGFMGFNQNIWGLALAGERAEGASPFTTQKEPQASLTSSSMGFTIIRHYGILMFSHFTVSCTPPP